MAITGSGTTVTDNVVDKLTEMHETADAFSSNAGGFNKISGEDVAGVTPQMAETIAAAIEEYVAKVNNSVSELRDLQVTGGIKGSVIETSAKSFINSVVNLCGDLVKELTLAEKDIVTQVQAAYATEESAIAGSMDADAYKG